MLKLRVERDLYRRMESAWKRCGLSDGRCAEVARRALRQYRAALARGERVDLAEFRQSATRAGSVPITLGVGRELVGELDAAGVRAVIAWALERAECRAREGPGMFVAAAVCGIDYVVIERTGTYE